MPHPPRKSVDDVTSTTFPGGWGTGGGVGDNGGMDFSAEARLAHAGTERAGGAPLAPPPPARHAGRAPLAPPRLATRTYVSQGEPDRERAYGRMANPGWTAVEEALAAIEGPGAV